jgi:hypothetical protein
LFDKDAATLSLFLGDREMQFSKGYAFALTGDPQGVLFADLNQDRKPELVFSESTSGKLVIYARREEPSKDAIERIAAFKQVNVSAASPLSTAAVIYDASDSSLIPISFERDCKWGARLALNQPVSALWQRKTQSGEEIIALNASPGALLRFKLKDNQLEKKMSAPIASFGASASVFWEGAKSAPSIVAVLDEKIAGALPQMLFYSIGREPNATVVNLMTQSPLNAEYVTAIAGMTIGKRMILARLVEKKSECAILLSEAALEGSRLNLRLLKEVNVPQPLRKARFKKIALSDFNGDEQPDAALLSESKLVVFSSESLYQPKQIATFARLSESDLLATVDANFDGSEDLAVTCHLRNEVLIIARSPNGRFQSPKLLLRNTWATSFSAAKVRQSPALIIGNNHLHAVDLVRLNR